MGPYGGDNAIWCGLWWRQTHVFWLRPLGTQGAVLPNKLRCLWNVHHESRFVPIEHKEFAACNMFVFPGGQLIKWYGWWVHIASNQPVHGPMVLWIDQCPPRTYLSSVNITIFLYSLYSIHYMVRGHNSLQNLNNLKVPQCLVTDQILNSSSDFNLRENSTYMRACSLVLDVWSQNDSECLSLGYTLHKAIPYESGMTKTHMIRHITSTLSKISIDRNSRNHACTKAYIKTWSSCLPTYLHTWIHA